MDAIDEKQLYQRTKTFALRILKLTATLARSSEEARMIAKQLMRSGTSVGAHYREAKRARSRKEMTSKLQGGQQELEETLYWLELLIEGSFVPEKQLSGLITEAEEIMSMLAASIITLKRETSSTHS